MASNPASEIASAIQSVSIKRNPSPHHDINPSTAASAKVPAILHSPSHSPTRSDSLSSATSTLPSDIIRPRPRNKSFPPIPDFRFEQSYLASIENAGGNWAVAWITFRDQLALPLAQGIMWNLAVLGWRYWNRGAKFSGQSLGARVRKWWWDVNHWNLPETSKSRAKDAGEFFVNNFGSSMGD